MNRRTQVGVRVSDVEHAQLEFLSKDFGEPMTALIRRAVREMYERRQREIAEATQLTRRAAAHR